MKKLLVIIIIAIAVSSATGAAANPLERGLKTDMEANPTSIEFGATADIVSAASGSFFKIFERGGVLQTEIPSVRNFDWNCLFRQLQVYNLQMAVVIGDQPIIKGHWGGLKQSMKTGLQASGSGGLAKWVKWGPDDAKYPLFHIETYEKGSWSGKVFLSEEEKAVQFDWTNFFSQQEKKGRWIYVGIEISGSPTPTLESPKWISSPAGNSWDSTYDWDIPIGSFAVEVKKDFTGVSKWKLIKRVEGKIIPQAQIKNTWAPSGSQEIKDEFQKNSSISKGNFVLLGTYSDKDIWIYEQ